MKQKLFNKLTSRKFWAGMVGVITPILVLLKTPDSEIAVVTGLVTSCGALIAYIFAESSVDIARESNGEKND